MKPLPIALGLAAALTLGACTTTPTGPVEVTRFVAADRTAELGRGSIFVESAAGLEGGILEGPVALAVPTARNPERIPPVAGAGPGHREPPKASGKQPCPPLFAPINQADPYCWGLFPICFFLL